MGQSIQAKNRKSLIVIIIEAIVLTVLIHAFFFFFFDYSPPTPRPTEQKPYKIMMLNLNDQRFSSQHQLIQWLEQQDPSITSRPNYRYGYSRWGRVERFRPPLSGAKIEPPRLVPPAELPPFTELRQEPIPAIATPAEMDGLRLIEPRSIYDLTPAATVRKYPLAVLNGKPLDNVVFSDLAGQKSARPTRLELLAGTSEWMMPHIRLIASSGNPALDATARQALLDFASHTPSTVWNEQEITVYWQPEEVQ